MIHKANFAPEMEKKKLMRITAEDYIRYNRKLLREEELERNGGRWIAKSRPHKNKKKYDRKRHKMEISKLLCQ